MGHGTTRPRRWALKFKNQIRDAINPGLAKAGKVYTDVGFAHNGSCSTGTGVTTKENGLASVPGRKWQSVRCILGDKYVGITYLHAKTKTQKGADAHHSSDASNSPIRHATNT
jgi:hypothetical protein